jgi:fatty acid desaturase
MVMRSDKEASASRERIWREQIDVVVGAEEIRSLSQQSLRAACVAITSLSIEVAILLAAVNLIPRLPVGWAVPVGIVLVLLIGMRINAFGVIVHEGSHGLLAKSRKLNDRLCNWGAAFWTINSVEEYRPTHRLHHRYLGGERDPDRSFYLVPSRRGALASLMLQDLVGLTAVRRAAGRLSGTSTESDAPASLLARPQLLIGKLITQLVILGQFLLFQGIARGILFYLVFWLVPIICVYPMILRLKTITEHYDPRLRDPTIVHWTARTSNAGWLQNHLIGAKMEYHFEHHVLPTIPYRGLRELHRRLDQSGMFNQNGQLLSHGYAQFLARAVTRKLERDVNRGNAA